MSLSSLIVQREIATIRQVEEALARQVLYGGDLVTNLLEVAMVDEGMLAEAAAEQAGLMAAPSGPLPAADERARSLLPADLAGRRSIYPLAMTADGEELVVVVAEPLPPNEEEQLMFALGVPIVQRLAPLVRIRQALAREYGAPIERRHERLVARLAGEIAITPGSMPPPLGSAPSAIVPPRPVSVAPPGLATSATSATSASGPPLAPAATRASTRPGEAPRLPRRTTTEQGFPTPALEFSAETPTDVQSLPPVRPSEMPTPATLVREVPSASSPPPPVRAVRRRRGPLTFERARIELTEVGDRDALLDLFFEYGRQYFDYTALFVVHGDLAEGRDAFGTGAARDKVLGIGVPLDMPSLFSRARETRAAVWAVPTPDGLDAVLLADMEREIRTDVMIVPVVVRGRVVALLYGDASDAGVDRQAVGDVVLLAQLAGSAFERLIVQKKLGGFKGGAKGSKAGRVDPSVLAAAAQERRARTSSRAPAERVQRAEVLGRAIHPDGASGSPSSPPPEQTSPSSSSPAPAPEAPQVPVAPILNVTAPAPTPAPMGAVPARFEAFIAESIPPPATPMPDTIITDRLDGDGDREEESKFAIPRRRFRISSPVPPPPVNAAVVRRPSGPPIPREDPDDPTARPPERPFVPPSAAVPTFGRTPSAPPPAYDARPRSSSPPASPLARSSSPAPEVAHEELDDVTASALLEGIPSEELDGEEEAPPSQTIVVAARLPPTSRTDAEALPSVIVDVSRELEDLVSRFLTDPNDESVEAELIHQGAQAMPAIMARFPGPIGSVPRVNEEESTAVSTCGPLLRLIAAQRRVALPSVLPYVADPDDERRFWATFLLSELAYPEALPLLIERLSDPNERIRRVARVAAAGMAKVHADELAREIGRIARDANVDRSRRLAMLGVLEDIREGLAVPTFISMLGDQEEDIAAAAKRALVSVTRQDFGREHRRWTTWWNQNSSRHRIEWLIDALVHESPAIRKGSGEELKAITKEYFGYYDDLPKRDRERAQMRYREWWKHEGQLKFAR